MTEKNDDLDIDIGAIAKRTPSDRRTGVIMETASDDTREGDDEGENMGETGVREHPVDEMLSETESVPGLTAEEEFTLHLKSSFDKSVGLGEELLRNNDLSLRERAAAIEVIVNDIDMMLDKPAIKADDERTIAGRATKSALQRTLEYTLQRLCLESANATPSTLPERIQGVSDTELERMSLGLGELELKAVTDEGKKEAQRLLEIISGDKSRRANSPRVSVPPPSGEPVDERGPTQAMSITPTPPAPEAKAQVVMIPPAPPAPEPISGAWQSGPEAQSIDQNKVVTQDAPAAEPSVILSPSMEAQVNEVKKHEQPVEPPLPVLRVGRDKSNDFPIDRPDVSGRHALLTLMPDKTLKVLDLQSTNGTFIEDVRLAPEGIANIGQKISFGGYVVLVTEDPQGRPFLSPIDTSGQPTGHTAGFEARSAMVERVHNEERARLQAQGVEQNETPKVEEKKPLKSPTEFELELKGKKSDGKKSSGWRAIGYAALALCLLGCLVGVGVYGGAYFLDGMWSDESTVAETETSTETPTEVTETSTPTETPVVETSTPVIAETPTGFSCRPGSTVASCERAEDFILARADGEAYWDCSGMSPDSFRDIYTREESGHVVVDTCACQLCEPTATP